MSKIHFLLSVFLATFFYVFLTFCFGQNGLWAKQQLELQREALSYKCVELQKQNDELKIRSESLQYDPDVVKAYARKIGYVADNERLITISGLQPSVDKMLKVESPYFKKPVQCLKEWACKFLGLAVFFIFELIFVLRKSVDNKSIDLR